MTHWWFSAFFSRETKIGSTPAQKGCLHWWWWKLTGYGCEWLHETVLFIPLANSVQVTSDLAVCAWAATFSRRRPRQSLGSGEHRLLRVPVSTRVGHAAPKWQGDELRARAASRSHDSHADTLWVRVMVRVVCHGISPANVDLVLLALAGGLPIDWVVEVHALGGVAPPVAPDQVDSGADQAEHHCGNDRNCMRLTHSGRDTGRGSVNEA